MKNKGRKPGKAASLEFVGLSAGHPTHLCNTITFGGAQANDVQSVCWATTSDQNQKTPDERDP
jgi:hypothetical protein